MYIINTYVSEIYIILNFEDIFDKFDIICQIWFDDALFKKKNYTPILLYVLIDGKTGLGLYLLGVIHKLRNRG